MIKSKFGLGVITPLVYFLFLTFSMSFLSKLIFETLMPLYIYLFYFVFLAVWFWLLVVVIRKKITRITIEGATIISRGFFGLGFASTYLFSDFDGYKTCMVASKGGLFENLYLVSGEKKLVRFSANYHRNYLELKIAVAEQVKNLGVEAYHIKNELKEVFN